MWGEERQSQGEVGAGEDGEGLDEDVGNGLVTGEVGVELVSVRREVWSAELFSCRLLLGVIVHRGGCGEYFS